MIDIKQLINEYLIIEIGCDLSDCLIVEGIFDNYVELVRLLDKTTYYIAEVQWWDRVYISRGSTLGGGGPRDPRAPDDFFFSEVPLYKEFEEVATSEDYLDYIYSVLSEYPHYDLYPSFDLRNRVMLN